MTTGTELRVREQDRRRAGRPAVFAVMLAVAALMALGIMLAGPAVGVAPAVVVATASLLIVALAWLLAGPRD